MRYNLLREFRNYYREIDKALFFSVVAMLGFSIINIYGIDGAQSPFFLRQIIYSLGGIGVMVAVSLFDYRYLKNHSAPALILLGIALILLLLTFTSQAIRGTNAWILIGGFSLEPSELAKIALIIVLAKYFSQRHIHINQFRHVIVSGIYFGLPMGIVLNQPDLGSGIILTAIWLGMLLAAGINKRHLFILAVAGVLISYFAWLFLLAPYQKARIATFINPEADPRGTGYNLIQSKIAIGSGFWFGNGVGKGSQSRLGFLPEPHNDFAFAAAVEQFGFVGAGGILGLMFFIAYKVLYVGSRASNNFGRLFSIGMAIFIFAHVFVSASVNTGIMPVTGIPFSLLSYGGSHMLAIMAGLGLLQSVKRYG